MDLLVEKGGNGNPTPRVWLRFTDNYKASMNIKFDSENGDDEKNSEHSIEDKGQISQMDQQI